MKKLLSILASLTVGASSASAVVACSNNITKVVNNNSSIDGSDSVKSHDSSNETAGKNADKPSNNGENSNSGNDNSSSNTALFNNPNFKVNMNEVGQIRDQAVKYAQKKILEDQYGINGDYLDKQLFENSYNPENGIVEEKNNLSNANTYGASKLPFLDYLAQAGILTPELKNQIENDILPMLSGIDVPSPTQLGGMLNSMMPFIGMLKGKITDAIKDPQAIKKTADGIFTPIAKGVIDNIIANGTNLNTKYDKLTVGDSVKSVLISVAYLFAFGTGDKTKAAQFADASDVTLFNKAATYLTQRIGLLTNTPKLNNIIALDLVNKTMNVTGSHLDSVATDGSQNNPNYDMTDKTKYFIRTMAKDNEAGDIYNDAIITSASLSSDKSSVNLSYQGNLADGSYLICYKPSDKAFEAFEADKEIQLQFWIKDGAVVTDPAGNIKQVSWGHAALGFDKDLLKDKESIVSLSDVIQLSALYIQQFDDYKLESGQDADHVFKDPKTGKPMNNYKAVTEVRNKKISDIRKENNGIRFNLFKFISDFGWYIGSLNNENGMYRLQAFLDMLFIDNDRSAEAAGTTLDKAPKFLLEWKQNFKSYWGNSSSDYNEVTDAESENMAPLTYVANEFIKTFLPLNEPDALKGDVDSKLGTFGISWADISECIRHNVYEILQSMVWNRGFQFSDIAIGNVLSKPLNLQLRNIDNGFHINFIVKIDFPGLWAISEWKDKLEPKGILNYLFDGDVYDAIDQVRKNSEFDKFFDQLASLLKQPTLKNQIDTQIDHVMSDLNPVAAEGKFSGESYIISDDDTDKYNYLSFKANGKESILGTDYSVSKPEIDIKWNGPTGSLGVRNTPYAKISKVLVFNNPDGTSSLYVYANDVANKNLENPYGNDGQSVLNADLFVKAIEVSGYSINGRKVIYDSNNTKYSDNVIARIDLNSKVTNLANIKVSAKAYHYSGYDWHAWAPWGKDNDGKNHDKVENAVISETGANLGFIKDEIGLASMQQFANLFTWDSIMGDKNHAVIKGTDFEFTSDDLSGKFKDFSVFGLNPGKGQKDKNGNPTDQYVALKTSIFERYEKHDKVNVQALANRSFSWVLGLAGVPGFDTTVSPLGLPIATKNTGADVILKLGSLINVQDVDKLTDSLDVKNFQKLFDVVFGVNGNGNIVDRLLDVLQENGGKFTTDFKKLMGITDTVNQYDKNGLIGALITAFTPTAIGAKDSSSNIVMGTVAPNSSPFWDYVVAVGNKAWNDLNDDDNSEAIKELLSGVQIVNDSDWAKADVDAQNAKGDERFNTISIDINYYYSWNGYKQSNMSWSTKKASYKLTISNCNPKKDAKDKRMHFHIEKVN